MARRSVDEHATRIAELLAPALHRLAEETVPLAEADGRLLAASVVARTPMPPFRNSQMDGYAAHADDVAVTPVTLPVDGVVAAGPTGSMTLAPGRLVRVMTGAPLPEGADCVIPVEDTADASPEAVTVLAPRSAGTFVREAGADLAAGDLVVASGTLLAARHLAAIAAAGVGEVRVRRRLRVAILTTGAEVRPPGAPLAFGEIHDANGVALVALVREAGAEVSSAHLVDDDRDAFTAALERALDGADLILTSGGVSQGDWEVVRQVLEPRGIEVTEIAMQPGGPQGSGMLGDVPVVCFPGNPVSTQVSFTVFVRPLLRQAAGLPPILPHRLPLGTALTSVPGKRQWRRGIVEDGLVLIHGGPGSHLVAAMARADVLVDVPAAVDTLAAGTEVEVVPL